MNTGLLFLYGNDKHTNGAVLTIIDESGKLLVSRHYTPNNVPHEKNVVEMVRAECLEMNAQLVVYLAKLMTCKEMDDIADG